MMTMEAMKTNLLNLLRMTPITPTIDDNPYNWEEILRLAKEQSVVGVALQGANRLSKDNRPPKALTLQWIGYAESIKRRNEQVNSVLTQVIVEMEEWGLHPITIKGQVVAQEYEESLYRQSGDIDIFFGNSEWKGVELWLKEKGLNFSRSAAEKHIEVEYDGMSLELHYHLNVFGSEQANDYWEKEIEDREASPQPSPKERKCRYVEINGTKVRTLGVTDTLVYLMVHVHHHLLTEGVGLRQLMDMCLFVHNHFDELDLSLLHRHVVGIGHEKAFNAYMALLNKYLGLPKEQIPFELDLQDYVYADKIMDEVWRGGNFGHKNNLKGVKPGLLHSLNTARLVIAHSMKFYRLAPAESRAYWWRKIFWRLRRKSHADSADGR